MGAWLVQVSPVSKTEQNHLWIWLIQPEVWKNQRWRWPLCASLTKWEMEEVAFTRLLGPALPIWGLTVPRQSLSSRVTSHGSAYTTIALHSHRNISHTCNSHLDHCMILAAQTACKMRCCCPPNAGSLQSVIHESWRINELHLGRLQRLTKKSKSLANRRGLHLYRKKKISDHRSNTLKASNLLHFTVPSGVKALR